MKSIPTTTSRTTGSLSRERLEALVTIDELAELLHVSKFTIYGWCTHRTIPFYKLGSTQGRSLFDPDEVVEWLQAWRVEPVGGAR